MHLKTLTVKGFKSFASATTLRLEPGITCVVGPNGSGKSNVVDAIAWVLGEQGAKALRGGKMEDVIFAGTAGRAAAGPGRGDADDRQHRRRAADRVHRGLDHPADVPLRRERVRDQRRRCRLLDIQELLSDSGIGREMHVIVGQGQLDAVLHAKPEDRRAFIEEAAGVLKHRKRKEKALRKLESMQANLNRLNDLTAELRRQLKPLGKQAEVARRAATSRPTCAMPGSGCSPTTWSRCGPRWRRRSPTRPPCGSGGSEVEARHEEIEARLAELEAALAEDAPELAHAQETWCSCPRCRSGCGPPTSSPQRLAQPDRREPRCGPGVTRTSSAPRPRRCGSRRRAAGGAGGGPGTAQRGGRGPPADGAGLADAEQALVAAVRAIADRREGLARLIGQVNAVRTRPRPPPRDRPARRRARGGAGAGEAAQEQYESRAAGADEADRGSDELDARHDGGRPARGEAAARGSRSSATSSARPRRRRRSWKAREEALALGLRRKDGAGALLARGRPGAAACSAASPRC